MRIIVLILFLLGMVAFAWAADVQIISLEGNVQVGNAGQKEFYPAKEGLILYPFDKIRTQKKSNVEIAFDDKKQNITRLEEDTQAVLLIQNEEKMELLKGRVFTMLENLPPGSAFEIRTPTAVSGARGTEWLTEVDNDGTNVESYSGKPYIQNITKEGKRSVERLFVTPGNMSRVRQFTPPAALTKIPEIKIKQWNDLKPVMRQRASQAINMPKIKQNTPPALQKNILRNSQANFSAPAEEFTAQSQSNKKDWSQDIQNIVEQGQAYIPPAKKKVLPTASVQEISPVSGKKKPAPVADEQRKAPIAQKNALPANKINVNKRSNASVQ